MKIPRNKKEGIAIVEVMVSIGIIVTGLAGVLGLISFALSSSRISSNRIVAANLSQEGIELARSIRDTNWRNGLAWNAGLVDGNWQVQFDSASLSGYTGFPLKFDSASRFYRYDTGVDTIFKRMIIISDNPDGDPLTKDMKVKVEVSWQEGGRNYLTALEDRLYDWH